MRQLKWEERGWERRCKLRDVGFTEAEGGKCSPVSNVQLPLRAGGELKRCHWSCQLGGPSMAQTENNSPATQDICVHSLGGEDPLEKRMATYSSILAWRIL